MAVVEMPDRRMERLIARMMAQYAHTVGRLAADFSAAAAFLLSDPLFDQLGCSSKAFAQAAKIAYAAQSRESVTEVRRRAADLIEKTDAALAIMTEAIERDRLLLAKQRSAGGALVEAAKRVSDEVADLVAAAIDDIRANAAATALDDPEALTAQLSEVAARAFAHVRAAWQPIYADLANASLPPAPLTFSGRGIYIETVKLMNQCRMTNGDTNSADSSKGFRGLLGGSRRQAARPTAEEQADTFAPVLTGIADLIGVAVDGWQRGALERAQRQGLESRSGIGEKALAERLALLERTAGQLSSLRAELANGLSVRRLYITLLRQAASCGSSA